MVIYLFLSHDSGNSTLALLQHPGGKVCRWTTIANSSLGESSYGVSSQKGAICTPETSIEDNTLARLCVTKPTWALGLLWSPRASRRPGHKGCLPKARALLFNDVEPDNLSTEPCINGSSEYFVLDKCITVMPWPGNLVPTQQAIEQNEKNLPFSSYFYQCYSIERHNLKSQLELSYVCYQSNSKSQPPMPFHSSHR